MATLKEIQADIITAMKAKDKVKRDTLRMVVSALKNLQIDLQRDLTEEDIETALGTEAKKRREAAKAFRDGDRIELAEGEEAELNVIEGYLPEQISDEELEAIVVEVIASSGARSKSDMGKVMGQVMPKVKRKCDGNRVRVAVSAKLG